MNQYNILGIMILIMVACTSTDRADWDSGGEARDTFREEAMQERQKSTNNQLPPVVKPHTEAAQPF